MAELRINYSQNGSPYLVEFQQNAVVVKTVFVSTSPDGNINFIDNIPDGIYDVNSYNLGKNPCVLVTGFSWFNPNKNFSSEGRAKQRGIFNGRKLLQKGIPFENNMQLTYGGNGYGGKNPVSLVVKSWQGQKGYFKQSGGGLLAKKPMLKISNDIPVSLDA